MPQPLSENLKFLCAEKPSVAQVCREIGINHQQFSKYLTDRARPSPHNLRRIARYFGLDETALNLPPDELIALFRARAATRSERRQDPLATAFPGDLARLRPYLGAYQVFFRAPLAGDGVLANAIFLDERNGIVHTRLIEALRASSGNSRRWTRCDGKASYQQGSVFVVDRERQSEAALSMSILTPPYRQDKRYLFGTMTFLASLPRRKPYASKVVWKKFESYRSVRELFETCGIYPASSRRLDPVVRRHLLIEES